jgi:HAE1 family hydrophobic/amphiphilic exporter-1
MNLADLSIKRPIFITCLVILSLVAGLMAMSRLGVDLFPDVTFPVVTVTIAYPGAGPSEVETLISKPIEDELSTLSGIKKLSSINNEGVATIIAEFALESDVKDSEQQVRDRLSLVKRLLPLEAKEPIVRRIDPSDQPILQLALDADMDEAKLYDLADDKIKPKLEQVPKVGLVTITGGRKREIQIQLDRNKLKARELSVTAIAGRLAGSGQDIPSGKKSQGEQETIFRTLGQFNSIDDIKKVVINFFGNDVPIRIEDVGVVSDSLQDETSRSFINGKKSLFIKAFKQSGSNTIAVVDGLKKKIDIINSQLATQPGHPHLTLVRDGSTWIKANVQDVRESIMLGIIFAVFVVFLFLANGRSTIITGLALPNSLIGAFILMATAGFTINIMTLLALSLSVGLLIDDAIVVRENIYRHIELGMSPKDAALFGTNEVRLAVIATSLTVIAVFGPLGFLKGVVGQFFKQFGLTICFAMAISLFDALTIAPMLSAYFAGASRHDPKKAKPSKPFLQIFWYLGEAYDQTIGRLLNGFSRFQDWLEAKYETVMHFCLKYPMRVLLASFAIFVGCMMLTKYVPKTFLPAQDAGEFSVSLDLPPGSNLSKMTDVALKVDQIIRKNPEVSVSAVEVGNAESESNTANFYVHLVDSKKRKINTSQFKDRLRDQLKDYSFANPAVKDYDAVGGGERPFNLDIYGTDQKKLEAASLKILARMKTYPGLKDVDVNFRPGKPEFQIRPDKSKAQALGMSTSLVGAELRAQVEGVLPAKFRENGLEYDVRIRLQEDQRNLKESFAQTYVPNLNGSLVRLQSVATPFATEGPSRITRQDRNRMVQLSGDIAAGAGLGNIVDDLTKMITQDPELKLPEGVTFAFVGQAENFKELGENMVFAMGAGVLFIFLVLSSLYESFVTPFTIMLALPLAICGSFVGLFLSHESLNIFSMIGIVMLLGVATKNSILLVDYAHQLIESGMSRNDAMIKAGKTRLRPILMTTMALIAGTIPIAIGLNEASRQRTSMGFAIIGGLISSTILTLIVVPASFSYVDRFRIWSQGILKKIFLPTMAK